MRDLRDKRVKRCLDIPDNLGSDRCKEKIDKILNDPEGYKVTDEYNHGDVRSKLRKYHGIKCVYCETSPIASSTFRIDHYRPKRNIKDLEDHTGYYWLAYEWSNLLQTCEHCNGKKSNYFPLKCEDERVYEDTPNALITKNPFEAPLLKEQRLLLNPELDEVEGFFKFKEDGDIDSDFSEGIESIEKYALDRGDLILVRKKIRDTNFKEIKTLLKEYNQDLIDNKNNALEFLKRGLFKLFNKWLSKYKFEEPYSMLYFFMFDKFRLFFVRYLPSNDDKTVLMELHQEFINQK